MPTQKETLEQEARRLRDIIYGKQTEANWEYAKESWIANIELLRRMVRDENRKTSS